MVPRSPESPVVRVRTRWRKDAVIIGPVVMGVAHSSCIKARARTASCRTSGSQKQDSRLSSLKQASHAVDRPLRRPDSVPGLGTKGVLGLTTETCPGIWQFVLSALYT